jgi:hypothetical protein
MNGESAIDLELYESTQSPGSGADDIVRVTLPGDNGCAGGCARGR